MSTGHVHNLEVHPAVFAEARRNPRFEIASGGLQGGKGRARFDDQDSAHGGPSFAVLPLKHKKCQPQKRRNAPLPALRRMKIGQNDVC
jgi:hypothetical protein